MFFREMLGVDLRERDAPRGKRESTGKGKFA
jgi:hypothetical protein